jgi:SWI/SNF-related matrix-associated actin-dependent regulator 1 of chromatin subfamily A
MKKTPRPFQTIGADFLSSTPHSLLGDEMGLGKTVTALLACEKRKLKRVAVVCPASVRSNWKQEIVECGLSLDNFEIESYNAAAASKFPAGPYDGIILDEAHFLKTVDSQRTQAIFGNKDGLVRGSSAAFKWCLTGTPVLNRPRELYPVLKTLHARGIAPYDNWDAFTNYFCGAYWDGRGLNTKGATHISELKERLKGFMLRRTKAEVVPELPPRIISHPPIELTNEELAPVFAMEAEIGDREAFLSPTHEDYSQLGDMARMLKVVGVCKVPQIAEFIEDILQTEKKVVVFARHRDVIKGLEEALGHCMPAVYHGGMNDAQKTRMVTEFMRNPDCEVFIGQIQAAGVGINGLQTVCNNVVFAELSWVPGEMSQAIDRCHRIGQNASCVNVYLPHVPGTLESAMLQVQLSKQTVIDALMGSSIPVVSEEENILEGLI